MRLVLGGLLSLALVAGPFARDGAVGMHRTTPRASYAASPTEAALGVPAGRAWGVESGLAAVPPDASVAATVEVRDAAVREVFLRVAYYDRDSGRPRQIATFDSPLVAAGAGARVVVALAPPSDAVAYRVRVLARVAPGVAATGAGAIAISDLLVDRAGDRRAPLTRLEGVAGEFP